MKQVRPVSDQSLGSTDSLMDVQTQVEVLQTATLTESTVSTMMRGGLKSGWAAYPSWWRNVNHRVAPPELPTARVLTSVAKSLKVRPAGQTRVIHIEADAGSPLLAADFLNTLVGEFIQQNITSRLHMVEAAAHLTHNQLSDIRQKLAASEKALQDYALAHKLVYTSGQQNVSDDRLRQVQTDLVHARTDLVEKEARRELAGSAKIEFLPDVVKDGDLRQLQARLIDLRRHEAELLIVFKPEYTEVKKVRAQAEELESAISVQRTSIVGRIANEYKESQQRETLLTAAYDDAVRSAAEESQAAVQYDILKREVDANMTAYQGMLTNVNELTLAAALRTTNLRIIDSAQPPKVPRSPKPPLNVVLGMISGLMLSAGIVLLQEHANQCLRHPGEARNRLGVIELGTIPSAGKAILKLKAKGFFSGARLKAGSELAKSSDDYYAPTSDGFRTIATSIMFHGPTAAPPGLSLSPVLHPAMAKALLRVIWLSLWRAQDDGSYLSTVISANQGSTLFSTCLIRSVWEICSRTVVTPQRRNTRSSELQQNG